VISAPARTGWYVYGVVGESAAASAETQAMTRSGVGSHGVRVIRAGNLAALASEVPLDDFGDDVLPERLNDPDWLERNARAHDDVLEAVLDDASVVPFRFGTIYLDRSEVGTMLDDRRDELERALERIEGRVELGVKAFADRSRVEESLRNRSGDDAGDEGGGAGTAYLLRRQRERRLEAEAEALSTEIVARAHEALRSVADAARVNRPQPPELSGRSDRMLLNASYLVARGDGRLSAEVRRLADEHREHGITFEVTGPWPAYNFVGAEEPE
jgi:hypothetical protein